MEEKNNQEKIEQFLRDELSEAEKKAFQHQLEADEALAKDFMIEEEIYNAVQANAEEDFRARLGKITNTSPRKMLKVKPIPVYQKPWFIAAGLLFLFGLIGFLLTYNPKENLQLLYAQYYRQPTFDLSRNNNTLDTRLVNAGNYYQEKKYNQTISALNAYLEYNEDPKLTLILGICYLESQQYQAAIETFDELRSKEILQDDATWYKALTLLKKGEINSAVLVFQELLSNRFPVTPKRRQIVVELLKKLEQ